MMRRRTRRARATKRAGYTLVEVMMAVAIMTVGSVGILSLTQATTMGNRDAREMSTGVEVARLYLERVRRDSLAWNSSGVGALSGTEFIQDGLVTNLDTWFIPAPTMSGHSYGFDFQGNDTTVLANMHYCTNLKMSWVIGQDAVRVDVRVWWHRTASNTDRSAATGLSCIAADVADVTDELDPAVTTSPRIRSVHASTVIHWQRVN